MAITRQKKESIVSELSASIKGASSLVFVHMKGVSVKDVEGLRKTLRDQSSGMRVVKKTLLRRALKDAGYAGEIPALDGEVAVAWSTDPLVPAREVFSFRKGREQGVVLLGGVYESKFIDATGAIALASIPPIPVLRGMFVNVINSPIQRFAIALGQIAEKKATS
jgi:large subunit ribosomal protein L10